jgi:ubiquinone/menaquinone biosynthesis C-methylase UbiE
MLPADMQEINRLDFQHYMLRYVFRGNYAAPIGYPRSILDVGTGTGRWASEMATQFPDAGVVGLDILPSPADEEARREGRPANYRFVQGNVLEGLPFPDASFDFVHMRLMALALPATRWSYVVSELVRVTQPGGWVESVEFAGEKHAGPAVAQLIRWGTQASALRGIDTAYSARVGVLLRAARLQRVRVREVDIPIGTYGGRVGVMMGVDLLTAMKALSSLYIAQGITSTYECEAVLQAAQVEVNSRRFRAVAPFHIAYGQRIG